MIEFLIRGWDLETVGRDRDNCGGGGRWGERALPQLKEGLVMSADFEYMELMLGRLPHTAAPVPGPYLPPEEWPGPAPIQRSDAELGARAWLRVGCGRHQLQEINPYLH